MIFLSGQDYPIKSKDYINKHFENNRDADFITFAIETDKIKSIQLRKDYIVMPVKNGEFYCQKRGVRGCVRMLIDILKRKLSWRSIRYIKIIMRKDAPFGMNVYKGSNWWALRYETAKIILDFYNENKKNIDDYFRLMLCVDEQFFHTIYAYLLYRGKIKSKMQDNLTYTDWSQGGSSPKVFQERDIEDLLNVGKNKLFARKFEENSKILDVIDREIKR